MKKYIVTILILSLFIFNINAQDNNRVKYFSCHVGTNTINNINLFDSKPTGFYVDFIIMHYLFLDFSTNFAKGQGTKIKLDNIKTKMFDQYNKRWYTVDFGVPAFASKNIIIVPNVGFIMLRDIYQDIIIPDTYIVLKDKAYFEMGLKLQFNLNNGLSLIVGSSYIPVIDTDTTKNPDKATFSFNVALGYGKFFK